ncbi:YceI family protein [Marinibacterium sp. SX1]|uniref:YceI family protein n=1 Tax=Marinibacterium sp. SX1 TaxID=3388424 RepID=UPI003D182C8C
MTRKIPQMPDTTSLIATAPARPGRRAFLASAGAAAGALLLAPRAGLAAARRYGLAEQASRVGFVYTLSGAAQTGTMPIASADIRLDPDNLVNSRVDVSVSVARARTGLIFATDALKSAEVLDAGRFPTIRFVSTRVGLGAGGRISDGATLSGNLTVRGVTRPVTFKASVFRPAGSAADDLDNLQVRLSGAISRSAFGASGYGDLVADRIGLDIQAGVQAI